MYRCLVFILSNVVFAYADTSDTIEPAKAPLVALNDGCKMPTVALGTWLGNSSTGRILSTGHDVEDAVIAALRAGYRHVDTAWAYLVEDQVGRAINAAIENHDRLTTTTTPATCDVICYLGKMKEGFYKPREDAPPIPREELFITTKLWNDAHARANVVPALRASLEELRLNYVDLYLMHWPIGQFANSTYDHTHYLETWRGMMDCIGLGLAHSIGVSNFNLDMLENIHSHKLAKPAVLQIEWNLNLQQPALLAYCRRHNITVMGYTPLGSLLPSRAAPGAPPPRIDDPVLKTIAVKYGKTVPQIVLRYALEMGVTPIPKSVTPSRIAENIDIFDFQLTENDKKILQAFDFGYRTVPQWKWQDHPFYPFETTTTTTVKTTTVRNNASRMRFIDVPMTF